MSTTKHGLRFRKHMSSLALFTFILVSTVVSACKSQERLAEIITVEGTMTVRGNEPFTAVMLETQDQNFYILRLTPEQRSSLMTPVRVRTTGRLYVDDWNGRPFAHLEVSEIESLE